MYRFESDGGYKLSNMTKLEKIKQEYKEKFGENSYYRELSNFYGNLDIPSNVEYKLWKEAIENSGVSEYADKKMIYTKEEKDKYEKFLSNIESDIQNRGHLAILDVLDGKTGELLGIVIDTKEPRLKSILLSHKDILLKIKEENLNN